MVSTLDRAGFRGRRGAGVLRNLVRMRSKGIASASVLETLMLRELRRAELPAPVQPTPAEEEDDLLRRLFG